MKTTLFHWLVLILNRIFQCHLHMLGGTKEHGLGVGRKGWMFSDGINNPPGCLTCSSRGLAQKSIEKCIKVLWKWGPIPPQSNNNCLGHRGSIVSIKLGFHSSEVHINCPWPWGVEHADHGPGCEESMDADPWHASWRFGVTHVPAVDQKKVGNVTELARWGSRSCKQRWWHHFPHPLRPGYRSLAEHESTNAFETSWNYHG